MKEYGFGENGMKKDKFRELEWKYKKISEQGKIVLVGDQNIWSRRKSGNIRKIQKHDKT